MKTTHKPGRWRKLSGPEILMLIAVFGVFGLVAYMGWESAQTPAEAAEWSVELKQIPKEHRLSTTCNVAGPPMPDMVLGCAGMFANEAHAWLIEREENGNPDGRHYTVTIEYHDGKKE